jgi:hypothetical protein
MRGSAVCAFFCVAIGIALVARAAAAEPAQPGGRIVIEIDDVTRFYKLYDDNGGQLTAEQIQRQYLDLGSDGLHRLAKERNVTAARIADALHQHPELYVDARKCMVVLPSVRRRVQDAVRRLAQVYPSIRYAPITIAVGRGRPVGITEAVGIEIGLEALCAADFLNPNVEDRFVHVLTHEFGHVQQVHALAEVDPPNVIEGSLVEGGAEFVAELVSGQVAYAHLAPLTRGRETEIESAWLSDQHSFDLSKWLYNDRGTAQWPGDLGYWVGYRINKAYYLHARDKRRALREILQMTDPDALLMRSGWYPGIKLQ